MIWQLIAIITCLKWAWSQCGKTRRIRKEGNSYLLFLRKIDTVLAVIGETMDASGDEICGCVVSIRKGQDRIALWLKSCDRKACTEVGARWKKCLEVSNKTPLVYQAHNDAAASGNSFRNEVKFAV